jgi:hypothetical protein
MSNIALPPRRKFLSTTLMTLGYVAMPLTTFARTVTAKARTLVATPMRLRIEDPALEPTTLQRIEVKDTEIKVHVDSFAIERIDGNATLRSRLTNGRLRIEFNLVFDVDVDWGLFSQARIQNEVRSEFSRAGLSNEQADRVVQIIRNRVTSGKTRATVKALSGVTQPGWDEDRSSSSQQQIAGETSVARLVFNIPLPNIPINLDPRFDIQNFTINNLDFQQKTNIVSDNINLSGLRLNDFEVLTQMPDPVSLQKAQVDEFRLAPVEVPAFQLRNIRSELNVPKIGSAAIPFSIESKDGSSDLHVPLLNWRPRWIATIDLGIVTIRITLGFDFLIDLFYRWVMTLLRVSVMLKNAFLNGIKVTLTIAQIAFTNLKVGLLKFARLIYSRA